MKVETLFAITHNSDLTEGRGYTVILGYTRTQELANRIVSDKRFARWCGMGFHDAADCKKNNVRQQDVVIFENAEELYTRELDVERQKALAKLTDHDKQILGLA
jgi:hypothetical protein